MFDPSTNRMGDDTPHATAGNTFAYDLKDKIVSIHQETSYLYPANNILIATTKKVSKTFGKDIRTKISWADNTIQFSGTAQSSSGVAFFTARFDDQSVFSLANEKGLLSIQFSDARHNHYSFSRDGTISCQSFRSQKKPSEEKKRVVLPTGTVVKQMENGMLETLFPDGSLATKAAGSKDWAVASIANDQRQSIETTHLGDIKICKENLVTVQKTKAGTVISEFPCLTSITTHMGEQCTVVCPDSATLLFDASGTQRVTVSDNYVVERTVTNGATTAIKVKRDNLVIEVQPSGDVLVQLSDRGFADAIPSGLNSLKINWLEGSLRMTDVCETEFVVNADATTSVVEPSTPKSFPKMQFGGSLLKDHLSRDPAAEAFTGNTPSLYIISTAGQESFQLHRDSDLLRHIHGQHMDNAKVIEQAGAVEGSLTLSTTRRLKFDKEDKSVLQYKHATRYSALTAEDRLHIYKEYSELLDSVAARSQTTSKAELGETIGALTKEDSRVWNDPFVYGANKDATQMAILLSQFQKQDIRTEDGADLNSDMQKLLANAKVLTKKTADREIKKVSPRRVKNSANYKVPKYFDGPEGSTYLQSVKSFSDEASKVVSADLLSEKPSEPFEALRATEESVHESKDVPPVSPETAAGDAYVKLEEPKLKESAEPTGPVEKPKKERKLKLPASILGAKPGVIPNSSHISREGDARRQLNTVSTAKHKKKDANYGVAGFVVLPAACKFGTIHTGAIESLTIEMTNVGLDSARFVVKQPKDSLVQVKYKHGPVAPGMSVKFTVTIAAGPEQRAVHEEILIVSETEILHIPVTANILGDFQL
ncbi:Sperm-associated antigen 17 [Kappamyces sp. JEL0680]|nr:Sperm-associated antigen 17 [Kappamyces sp. JEL0680]